jgi:putative transcriptional regulator
MSGDSAPLNLTNHFLIAMPGLEDALFAKSVVYMCEHSARGALGLIINKPADFQMRELFAKVEMPLAREDLVDAPVLQGGPMQTERGFVLHAGVTPSYASTMAIEGGLQMTTSKDVLQALSLGAGPQQVLLSLGYSSWGEGQLESELGANSWLTVQADRRVIFDTPMEQRYNMALALLGLEAWMISSQAGHA